LRRAAYAALSVKSARACKNAPIRRMVRIALRWKTTLAGALG
jgi:hypothetical protein